MPIIPSVLLRTSAEGQTAWRGSFPEVLSTATAYKSNLIDRPQHNVSACMSISTAAAHATPRHLCRFYQRIACPTHLDEVLVAPWVAELVGLPCLIHSQQCDVVTLSLEELGTLLVSLAGTARGQDRKQTVRIGAPPVACTSQSEGLYQVCPLQMLPDTKATRVTQMQQWCRVAAPSINKAW